MRYFLITLLVLLVLVACRDEKEETKCWEPTNPNCENYDPCYGETEVSADFEIGNRFGVLPEVRDIFIEDSLFLSGEFLRFKAKEKGAYYKWYLGTELIEGYGDSLVGRTLVNLPVGRYTAALKVNKAPNLDCQPNDDGEDSVMKYFYVVEPCDLMISNRFRGVFEGFEQDSVEIEFIFADFHFTQACAGEQLFGINLLAPNLDSIVGFDTVRTSLIGLADKRAEWRGSGSSDLKGSAYLNRKKQSIELDYYLKRQHHVFHGRVIP